MPPQAESTSVQVAEQVHPLVAAIDERMPVITEMLPAGMDARRFRRVVVQALTRNPDLFKCTPVSVVLAITEAAEAGIEPTGVLGKGWLLPYNVKVGDGRYEKQAKFIPGWRGFADLAWRADRILISADVVRTGDEFNYRRGTSAFLHHIPMLDDPEREADDANITAAYVLARFPDGREEFEVMSRRAIERIRDRAKKTNPVWVSDFAEMAKKTPVRRLAKRLPLSPTVQRILAADEEVDLDTPAERVPDDRAAALRERIGQRTAAIRGEEPPTQRDPWMARLHAVGAERGMDHGAIHDLAADTFGVDSITVLNTSQRADLMEVVEALDPITDLPDAPTYDGDLGVDEVAFDEPQDGERDTSGGVTNATTRSAATEQPESGAGGVEPEAAQEGSGEPPATRAEDMPADEALTAGAALAGKS